MKRVIGINQVILLYLLLCFILSAGMLWIGLVPESYETTRKLILEIATSRILESVALIALSSFSIPP